MHQRKLAAKPRRNLTPEQQAKDYHYNTCYCGKPKVRAAPICWNCRTERNRTKVTKHTFYMGGRPCRYIGLTQDKKTIISAHRYKELSQYNWYPIKGKHTFYVVRWDRKRKCNVTMHADIVGAKGVDHANGDGLDNRDENLRKCTQSQNNGNSRKRIQNKTGFKGVRRRSDRVWQARIRFQGIDKYLGSFSDAKSAAHAYDIAAIATFGEFARTNFPRSNYNLHPKP